MGEERRVYPAEFKKSAVELVESSGRPVADVANELGLHRNLLDRWRRESRESVDGNLKEFVGQGNPRDEELARLRKENADLRETNEILKKSVAIFSQWRTR